MALFGRKKEEDKNKKKASQNEAEIGAGKAKSTRELYAAAEAGSKKKKAIKKDSAAYKILKKPLVTEKATVLGSLNKYVFEVSNEANKIEIAKAIFQVYGVKPVNINIIKVGGKKVRYGRTLGKRKDWKKAIITLPEGESIKVYEGV